MFRRWLAVVLMLSGCATGYGPKGFGGGYSEVQLNARTFQVNFSGNGWTSMERAHRGALHRAAELTAARGFFGFVIASQSIDTVTSTYTDPIHCTTIGYSTTCTGGNTNLIEKPKAVLMIRMVTIEEAGRAGGIVYDARLILAQIQYD